MLQQRKPAAHRRFRRDIEDGGRTGCAGLPPIAHRRQRLDALFDQRGGGLHVHHLRAARIADGAAIADDQHGLLIDAEARVLDARVIILRAFEDGGLAFEHIRVVGEEALAEFLVDDADLDDGVVEDVAGQHQVAGLLLHRLGVGADHVPIRAEGDGGQVLGHRLAGRGHHIAMQAAGGEQFLHHRGHAAGAVEALTQEAAGGLAIDQQRDIGANALPVIQRVLHAHVARDGDHVRRAVGGRADGGRHRHRILERLLRHDVGGAEIGLHHLHDPPAAEIGHLGAFAMGPGDGGAAGQAHADGFHQAVHRQRRPHGGAMAPGGGGGRDHVHEAAIIQLACGQHAAGFPHHGAGADQPPLVPAIQHRPARQRESGNVDGGSRHQRRTRRLIAADGHHDAIHRVAVQDLDQREVLQVAVQRRRGALQRFLDLVDREFQRHAAGVTNAFLHPLRQDGVVAVAGRDVGPGLGDADDRPAGLQFVPGQAVIQHTLAIERGHAGVGLVVEPALAPQREGLLRLVVIVVVVCHGALPHRAVALAPGRRHGRAQPPAGRRPRQE